MDPKNELIDGEVDEFEDEEGEDSLEYVETEPVLAYSRMKNDINEILLNDSVSCIKADHKVNLIIQIKDHFKKY